MLEALANANELHHDPLLAEQLPRQVPFWKKSYRYLQRLAQESACQAEGSPIANCKQNAPSLYDQKAKCCGLETVIRLETISFAPVAQARSETSKRPSSELKACVNLSILGPSCSSDLLVVRPQEL